MTQDSITATAGRPLCALATGVTSYLLWRTMKPPRPIQVETSIDSVKYGKGLLAGSFAGLAAYRTFVLGLSGLNVAAALTGPPFNQAFGSLGPYASHIDARFVGWNELSAAVLTLTSVASVARLRAMSELGANFTFDLHDPDRLITDGIYKYVQHPSYTAAFLSSLPGSLWFVRCDGAVGALLPPWFFALFKKYEKYVHLFLIFGTIFGITRRVLDEEEMLKKKFGREWEEWHGKTARFVPFLF